MKVLDFNLYPQFNYCVDTTKLINAVNDLKIQVNSSNQDCMFLDTTVKSSGIKIEEGPMIKKETADIFSPESAHDCFVTSGINTDGRFWVQLLSLDDICLPSTDNLSFSTCQPLEGEENSSFKKNHQRVNQFIEEVSKFVRRKRISDAKW